MVRLALIAVTRTDFKRNIVYRLAVMQPLGSRLQLVPLYPCSYPDALNQITDELKRLDEVDQVVLEARTCEVKVWLEGGFTPKDEFHKKVFAIFQSAKLPVERMFSYLKRPAPEKKTTRRDFAEDLDIVRRLTI